LPAETKHIDVDLVLVTEQVRGPVVLADCAVAVDVALVLSLDVLVVEEAVLSVEDADVVDSVVASDVVVASVEDGAVVEVVFADAVLLVVFLVVVFPSVVVSSAVVSSSSCLLFNSSNPARQSNVNQTASAVASAIEHPPETRQSSISSRRDRSRFPCKHCEITLLAPQDIRATRSSRLLWAHPVAETTAAETNIANTVERMVFDAAFRWHNGRKGGAWDRVRYVAAHKWNEMSRARYDESRMYRKLQITGTRTEKFMETGKVRF